MAHGSQGYGIGRYDILFATNVLHATRNMEVAIQNCKALLRNGGLLIANELSAKTAFLTLTFGLTDGWWLYDDVQRRIPGKDPNMQGPSHSTFLPVMHASDVVSACFSKADCKACGRT